MTHWVCTGCRGSTILSSSSDRFGSVEPLGLSTTTTSTTVAASASAAVSAAQVAGGWLPIGWSLVALVILFYAWRSGLLSQLVERITDVQGFGVSFRFDRESARVTRANLEGKLENVTATIRREIEAEVRSRGLQGSLRATVCASRLGRKPDYRATIHIADPLYRDYLYQLLDYYPNGNGHGRRFSVRAGLIGLAWRTNRWQQDQWSETLSLDELIEKWGMTHREAAKRHVAGRVESMLAVPLEAPRGNRVLGILYLDSEVAHRFGCTDLQISQLVDELQRLVRGGLSRDLEDLVRLAMERSPQLALEPD